MAKGLYFAYLKAWRQEQPASKYDLTPGAALMLRAIIDETNSHFWPAMPIRIDNRTLYDACNIKNRKTLKTYRDELIKKKLIDWHRDASDKTKSGFYKLIWKPNLFIEEINNQVRNLEVTPTTLKLAIING